MDEFRKEIHELESLAFESVINRDYEHASYYYYWLLKKTEETAHKDINYENESFYFFYYYICSKIRNTWIFKNHDEIRTYLLLLVKPENLTGIPQKTIISQLTGLLVTHLVNVKLVDNYCINLQYILLRIEKMVFGEYKPDESISDYSMVLSKYVSDIIRIYRENVWSNNDLMALYDESIYFHKIREKEDVISIVSLFLPNYKNIGNLLFRVSSLIYLYGVAAYLFSVMNFLRKILKGALDFETLNSDISYLKKVFEAGLDIYPTNYQIVGALEFFDKFNLETTTPLKYNHLKVSLQMYCNYGYLNEGSKLNNNGKFNEAEQCYNEGLNYSLIGDKSHLYYNLAKNYQDLLYGSAYTDLNRNMYADNSIRYAQYSLFDSNLSLMNIFSLDSIITNDSYAKIRNSVQCYGLIGITYSEMNNNDAAIRAYSSALSFWENNYNTNSEIGDIFSNRALSFLRIKEYDKSIEDSQTALFYKPKKPVSALLNIAYCYFHKNNYDTALSYYNRILSISKDNVELGNTYHSIGLSYLNLGELDDAIEYCKKAINKNSNAALIYSNIGRAYQQKDEFCEAEKNYLIAANMGLFNIYYDIGKMFFNVRDEKKSKNYFELYIKHSLEKYYLDILQYPTAFFQDKCFFKYKAINKFTMESLIHDYIYFSDISGLNDPFDCELIEKMNMISTLNEVFLNTGMPKIMSMSYWADETQLLKDHLLWSHYADEHKGIRIGFRFSIEFLLENNIIYSPIKYIDELDDYLISGLFGVTKTVVKKEENRIIIDVPDKEDNFKNLEQGGELLDAIIRKRKDWEYESEVRLIVFDKDNKKYNNRERNLFTIQNITFGCRTTDDDIQTILTIFYNRYSNNAEFRIENNKFYNGDSTLIEFLKVRRSKDSLFTLENDDAFSVEKYLF